MTYENKRNENIRDDRKQGAGQPGQQGQYNKDKGIGQNKEQTPHKKETLGHRDQDNRGDQNRPNKGDVTGQNRR